MKIHKLMLLAALGTSTAFSAVEYNFNNGELDAPITGGIIFNGSGDCLFTGSLTGEAELHAGNVQVYNMDRFGGDIAMSGGTLELLADDELHTAEDNTNVTIPSLHMDTAGTITIHKSAILAADDGDGKLTILGDGEGTGVSFDGDLSGYTGGLEMGPDLSAHFIATTVLPNADNTFNGAVYLDAPRTTPNKYDSAGKTLTAAAFYVANGFGEVRSNLFQGAVKTNEINLSSDSIWRVPVSAR